MLGIQAIRQRGGNDLRNRASREDQEWAVQDGQARRVQCDDDGTVERGTRSLSPQFAIAKHGGACPSLHRLEFAPTPLKSREEREPRTPAVTSRADPRES